MGGRRPAIGGRLLGSVVGTDVRTSENSAVGAQHSSPKRRSLAVGYSESLQSWVALKFCRWRSEVSCCCLIFDADMQDFCSAAGGQQPAVRILRFARDRLLAQISSAVGGRRSVVGGRRSDRLLFGSFLYTVWFGFRGIDSYRGEDFPSLNIERWNSKGRSGYSFDSIYKIHFATFLHRSFEVIQIWLTHQSIWLELGEKRQHDQPLTTHDPPPTACFEGGKSKNISVKHLFLILSN